MGNPVFNLGGTQLGTNTNVTYASPENYVQQAPDKTIYTNFQELFDDNSNAKDGIQLNSNNLINKDWLESKYYELIRRGNLEFNNENLKYLKNLGKTALNYQKYFSNGNPIAGVNPKKAYNAQKEFDRAKKLVLDWSQSLKQKRYKVDENGNPVLVYEGAEGFNDGYNTAEEAKAAYAQQQQYNKDARSWAGRNYMEDHEYWNGQNVYDKNLGQTHEDVINKLSNIAGITDSDLISKAKSGNVWGANSDAIFQKAIDTLAAKDYQKAVRLYNQVKGMYGSDKPLQFAKNFTLYDGSNAFTDANKRNWLESEAGVNDVKQFYQRDKSNPGYMDDYKDYVKKQKEVADWQKENGGFGASYSTQFKQGGKMNKYQQGGQAPTAAQMVLQALSAAQQGDQSGLQQLFSDKKTAQAVIQQLQKEAQEGSEEAVQALEALKQIMSGSKKQATMAQKGAKLSYIHRLATGCPPGMEMTYFKKGGRLCKACIEKAKKAKEGASLDNIIAKNKRRYPGITDDQAAGRAPIRKNGKDYYLGGDGVLSEAPKKGKYGFGGFFEYFKSGGKNPVKRVSKEITDDGYEMKFSDGTSSNYGRNPMNGKSVAIGRDGKTYTGEKADSVLRTDSQKTVPAIKANKKKSMACGGKAKKSKCGTKAKCGAELKKCGGKTPMDKCGGKTTLAKCGAELEKCGGKAKKISSKKPVVNKDKCGGKAKKHAIGGNLELLKYMILNYNK